MLAAQWMGAPQDRIDQLAVLFIAARLAYLGLYLADKATLRSVVWAVGLGASIALYLAKSF